MNPQQIILAAGFLGAITVIGGFFYKLYKAFYQIHKALNRFEKLESDNSERKEENAILIKSVFAICDGLHQLGANGPVTKARDELQEYIIKN